MLNITQPASENGIPAKVKGTFSNGVLTAVQITDAGADMMVDLTQMLVLTIVLGYL